MRLSKAYFSDSELACKGTTCKCKGVKLNPIFDEKFFLLRQRVNEPMIPNSCCRCAIHNKAVKGAAKSFHLYDDTGFKTNGTCAVDIPRGSPSFNIKLVLEAWDLGMRIGVHPNFFHLDVAPDVVGLPQIVFSYGTTDPKDLAKWKKIVG